MNCRITPQAVPEAARFDAFLKPNSPSTSADFVEIIRRGLEPICQSILDPLLKPMRLAIAAGMVIWFFACDCRNHRKKYFHAT